VGGQKYLPPAFSAFPRVNGKVLRRPVPQQLTFVIIIATMPRGNELSPQLRARICALADIGWPYPMIARKYELSFWTVRYTIRMEGKRTANKSLQRSGRPKIIDEQTKQDLLEMVWQQPRNTMEFFTNFVRSKVDSELHAKSVKRLFRTLGMKKWKTLRRPLLTEAHAAKRLF
jgi:transposase